MNQQDYASCINFADGGKKYIFYLKNNKKGFPVVKYAVNNKTFDPDTWPEFSTDEYGEAEFYTFKDNPKGEWQKFKNKSDPDKDIEIKKIAANNNRVFCYAQQKSGGLTLHRFFWAQMEDEFPAEPGIPSIPGLYVKKQTDVNDRKKRYEELDSKFKKFSEHPVWAMQNYGSKANFDFLDLPVPIIVKKCKWYEIDLKAKGIDEVYDIGVANPHRYESYKKEIGGEIMAFIYNQKLEDFKNSRLSYLDLIFPIKSIVFKLIKDNVLPSIFPNMKVHDGAGYIDGTCNFFVLAKVKNGPNLSKISNHVIYWCDEQEIFAEKWRVIHPDDCDYKNPISEWTGILPLIKNFYTNSSDIELGNFKLKELSIHRILEALIVKNPFNKEDNNIKDFYKTFMNNLPYDKIDENSRMAVSRSAALFTGKDDFIYSITYMWGVTDFQWNKRNKPKYDKILYPGSIQFRDDTTIYMMGYKKMDKKSNAEPVCFYQKYLPPSILQNDFSKKLYSTKEFNHNWYIVKPEVFEVMDKYYNFGIYDAFDENNPEKVKNYGGFFPFHKDRSHYAYPGIDERSQYYIIKPANSANQNTIIKLIKEKTIEWSPKHNVYNPFFSPYKSKVKLKISLRWDAVLKRLIAVYAHPRDDDIYIDMERSGYLTELTPLDEDLRGEWIPEDVKNPLNKLDWITLGIIYFKPDSSDYRDAAQVEKLKQLTGEIIEHYTSYNIEFIGHCAEVPGSKVDENELSYKRAKKVYEHITNEISLNQFINTKDISHKQYENNYNFKGMGFKDPAAENITEAGMRLNRRVEIKIKTSNYFFKFKERIRDFSPPSVKEAKLKMNKNRISVTVKTNDSSIRYITVGAVIKGKAQPISERYEITYNTVYSNKIDLFLNDYKKEKAKKEYFSIFYMEDIRQMLNLENAKELKEGEEIINKFIETFNTIKRKKYIDKLINNLKNNLRKMKRMKKIDFQIDIIKFFKDILEEFEDKFRDMELDLDPPETFTFHIPLLDIGKNNEYFKKDSHFKYGTNVWFEDILGHKSMPEELIINDVNQTI